MTLAGRGAALRCVRRPVPRRDDMVRRMERTVRLSDVAREAGVSVATASRALNGSSRVVAPKDRDRVVQIAERLGYRVNVHAQATARGTSGVVGLIVSDLADPYFSMLTMGMHARAGAAGVMVTLGLSERDSARELAVVRTFEGQHPRSLIIAGSRSIGDALAVELERELLRFREGGGGVVLVGSSDLPFDVVEPENRQGAERLADTLVDLGYRRFAIVAGPAELRTVADRVDGFVGRLGEREVAIDPPLVYRDALSRNGGYLAMARLLHDCSGQFDAVFAVTDAMAIGAMSAIRDAGLAPGVDIAVAGFDDIPTARDVNPRLTTVRVPLIDLGAAAMDFALNPAASPRRVVLPTEVVLRQSTPPHDAAFE